MLRGATCAWLRACSTTGCSSLRGLVVGVHLLAQLLASGHQHRGFFFNGGFVFALECFFQCFDGGFDAFFLACVQFVAMIQPYVTARMQNLVWNHTQSDDIRIHSTLKARSMVWLSLKNWFLVVCTLGFYWPFAAVARARMQLEAMGISSHIGLDALVSHARSHEGEAAGDAAGDLFGLDIGF